MEKIDLFEWLRNTENANILREEINKKCKIGVWKIDNENSDCYKAIEIFNVIARIPIERLQEEKPYFIMGEGLCKD